MRHTAIDSEVIVVLDGKSHKGTITDVLSQGAARIQMGKSGGSVQASYSATGAEGTFHYPDEAAAAKKAAVASPPPTHKKPDAAAPAKSTN